MEPTKQEAGKRVWERLEPNRLAAAVAARRAERGSTVRMGGISETERDAAEAYLQAVDRGEVADARGLAAPHACDVWRRNVTRIQAVIGEREYRSWVTGLTPIEDDGETLEVACSTRMIADFVKENFGETIEGIIGRRLVVKVTLWAGPAADKRAKSGGWCGEVAKQRGIG